MSNRITFSSIKLDTVENIKKDDNGNYLVLLGALNMFNTSGSFYLADGVDELMNDVSRTLGKQLANGYLRGEAGHPKYVTGMSVEQFKLRNMLVDKANESHAIKQLIFKETNTPSNYKGKKVINIYGLVKPLGGKGLGLQQELDDPELNTAFSIRCFTRDKLVAGVNVKEILDIITWDWVTEPGIKTANKWSTLALESSDVFGFSLDEIDNGEMEKCLSCSLEHQEVKNRFKELRKRVLTPKNKYDIFDNFR